MRVKPAPLKQACHMNTRPTPTKKCLGASYWRIPRYIIVFALAVSIFSTFLAYLFCSSLIITVWHCLALSLLFIVIALSLLLIAIGLILPTSNPTLTPDYPLGISWR